MKILSKLKKVIIGIGTFVIALPVKIYGAMEDAIAPLYGPPSQMLYGPAPVNEPSRFQIILRFLKTLIIPTLFIIGLIVIIKNKKMSRISKIIMLLLVASIIIIARIIYLTLEMHT